MASDLSSGCTEAINMDEKEEGELSLDDVSSSEEGHVRYGSNARSLEQCPGCSSSQHCASWCTIAARSNHSKELHQKEVRLVLQDAVQGKENCHLVKSTGHPGGKNTSSTLQEKNDLIPISSDSDMEIVRLTESTHRAQSSKVKKKRKKRKPRPSSIQMEEAVSEEIRQNISMVKFNPMATKKDRLLKVHHREKNPSHKSRFSPKRHRSSPTKNRVVAKIPKSPTVHTMTRKSLKKLKSPGRSQHKVLVNPLHKKVRRHPSPPKFAPSPVSDVRVTRLLKKVRLLEMVGTLKSDKATNKTKEYGSSLKDKLFNILKPTPENMENTTSTTNEDSCEKKNENGEEEDDLIILRQKALETKQSKTNKSQESLNNESDIKGSSNNENDDDDEDLKLRLIALRSAVYKKHRNRVQRAGKSPNKKKDPHPRSESPFSESFINNVAVAEDDEDNAVFSPELSRTSSPMKNCTSLEDMDLDSSSEKNTDINEAPYSPTDEVNSELILEAEQLGIDATDVSLININSRPPNKLSSPLANTVEEFTPPIDNVYCNSNFPLTSLNSNFRYPISRSSLLCVPPIRDPQSRIFNEERAYSPSDTVIFDPDLTESLLPQNDTFNKSSTETPNYVNNLGGKNNNSHTDALHSAKAVEIKETNLSMPSNFNMTQSTLSSSMYINTLITDDLPEVDIDGSPLVPMEKDSSTHYHIPGHLSYPIQPLYQALYLRNESYDVNDFPTMMNVPLVPPGVSRFNKQPQEEPKRSPVSIRMMEAETNSGMQSNSMNSTQIAQKQIENPELDDQIRKESVLEVNKKNQRKKENVSANTYKELNISRKNRKKIARKSRRSSMRSSIGNEKNKTSPNKKERNKNSVCEANEESAKRSRTLETKRQTNEKVPSKKVEIVNKVKSKKRKSNEENLDGNTENNLERQKNPKEHDAGNDNTKIIVNSETRQSTENEKAKDGKPLLSESNIENIATSTEVQDPKANAGSRRRSIDEDEEALRAILLASIKKRRVQDEVATKTNNESSEKAAPNNQTNIQTKKTTSLPAASKERTETIPEKLVNSNSSAASVTKVSVNNSEAANSSLGKRKVSSTILSGSPRKIIKRTIIPASTKVVNNAKRYQNSLMQKRLNLQKSNMAFNAKRVIANKSLSALNYSQNTRSNSPNVPLLNQGERFIISLNSDSETDSESEERNTSVAIARKSSVEKRPTLTIPTTEFERSVDQFLRDVRQKQESTAGTKQPTNPPLAKNQPPPEIPIKNGKSVTLPATPLAVRHLPASQQEEYHRLKQQILEREKLKLQRTSISQQTSDTNTVTPPGPVSPIGPTSSSNQKTVSAAVTKNSTVDSLPSTSCLNSSLASQSKANLTIKIRNDRISPVQNSRNMSPNIQNIAQANTQEPPKQVTMPKLRILTCEQVNKKFLQIQVKQKEDGRKVIIGDTKSPRKSNNISSLKRNELPNLSTAQREVITIEDNDCIANKNSVANRSVDSNASNINVSKSKASNMTNDLQVSTVDTTAGKESKINKTADSVASIIISSHHCGIIVTSVSGDNDTASSSITTSKTPVDFEKRKQISIETPESSVRTESTVSKVTTVPKKPTVPKEPTVTKKPTVVKELPSSKPTTDPKPTTVSKPPPVPKPITISKPPTDPKPKSVSKPPIDPKPTIVSKPPINPIPREKTAVISLSGATSSSSKPLEPDREEEARKERTVAQKASKTTDKKKCDEAWDQIKNAVQVEVEELLKLGETEKKRKLVETEQKLIAKRYVVLDDLVEVSGSLKQWETDKNSQANLAGEVKKLREQLRETEKKYQEQNDRVAAMGLKVSTVQKKMNIGRKECFKLAKICTGLGSQIIGQTYKVPDKGVQLINNRLKEVAEHTRKLSKSNHERKRKLSDTEKSVKRVSEAVSNEREKSARSVERQDSYESVASCEREIYSESQSSTETVTDEFEKGNCHEDSSQKESEPVEIQSFTGKLAPPVSISQKENEKDDPKESEKDDSKDSEKNNSKDSEKDNSKDSCETGENNDSSSRKENSESVDMCHTKNDTQNQSSKPDNQLNKQPVRPYVSILTHMKTPRSSQPNGILCPYQLMGSCHDGECQFIHHPSSHWQF